MSESPSHLIVREHAFDELDGRLLYEILRLRSEIFVVEQTCIYLDLDRIDYRARHLTIEENGELVAAARWFDGPEGLTLGRIVTRSDRRGRGHGKRLVREALARIGDVDVVMHAQAHLERFYRELGFAVEGLPFLEDGIPHLHMVRRRIGR